MEIKNYVIGLDLGVNNVGWSILNLDDNKIEKAGVRLYNPSDDASTRRGARSVRRREKRLKNRITDTMALFKKIGFEDIRCVDQFLIEKRVKGLNNKISKQDIINIVCYFMSHRGYIPYDDEEVNFVDLNGMYPCEYYNNLLQKQNKYRALNETVKNSELKRELIQILKTQAKYYIELNNIIDDIIEIFSRKREFWEGPGNLKAPSSYGRFKTKKEIEEYLEKKKVNKAYEKYLFEDLIGHCEVYLNEKCAPRLNYHAQEFNLLNDFINLTISDITDINCLADIYEVKHGYKFSTIGLKKIIDYCKNNSSLKIDTLFKKLFNIDRNNISGFRIDKKEKIEISTLNEYRSIKKLSEKNKLEKVLWLEDINAYNKIMYYINVAPSSIKLLDMIIGDATLSSIIKEEEYDLIKNVYKQFKNNGKLGYHSLSEKALHRACDDMIATRLNYQQVSRKLDYDEEKRENFEKNYIQDNGKALMTCEYIDDLIASPQVKKTLRQAIKVINAIIEEKQSFPYCIAIESAKEMNGKDKKNELILEQRKYEDRRKKAVAIIESNGHDVTNVLTTKVMLYLEINGSCPYCNRPIELSDVLNNRIEIEHILPISKSCDNSYDNKTISCSDCNHKKNNNTPYEWKKATGFEEFEERIKTYNISDKKRRNFLFQDDLNRYKIRFFNRNLRDTAYATTELINQIQLFNYFIKSKYGLYINTLSTPGQITHKLRVDNSLDKDRDDGKYHHAVDASIVASICNTNIGKVIIESQNNEKYWINNRNKMKECSEWLYKVNLAKNIDQIREINNDNIYISSQVIKSAQGQLSNANIVKYVEDEGQYYKIGQIDNIYEAKNKDLSDFFNDNSKKGTLMIKDNNKEVYELLRNIYLKYKDEPGNAFKNYCFDKYQSEEFTDIKQFDINKHGIRSSLNNDKSPMLKKLRYYQRVTSPYLLEKNNINNTKSIIGLDSLSQYCTEIYLDIDNNKFLFLPIFSICVDLKSNKINRDNEYYKKIKDIYLKDNNVKFITRVYNGSYLKIYKKNGNIVSGIYSYFHKTNNILILKNDYTMSVNDLGFTLYDVDILGNKKERLTYKVK